MVVGLKVFKVFVDETTENCYANYKVNRNFIYLITKSRRKLVRNMAKAVRMADIAGLLLGCARCPSRFLTEAPSAYRLLR